MAELLIDSAEEILERALDSLSSSTQITRVDPGSKARALMDIFASELERTEARMHSNVVLSLINGASGLYLDFLGELLGVPRSDFSPAEVSSLDGIIKISTPISPDGQTPTFGQMNGGESISIPGGTFIETEDGNTTFRTTESMTLRADETESFISAMGVGVSGQNTNIPQGVLTGLRFTNYAAYPSRVLEVSNLSSIQNGTDEEGDDFYRFRLQNALTALEGANESSVRLALLSLPGVRDVVIINQARGIGTANIVLETTTRRIGPSLAAHARARIRDIIALGVSAEIKLPDYIGIRISIRVRYLAGALRDSVNSRIRERIQRLVLDLALGETLEVNTLAAEILGASSEIDDIGLPGRPIDQIFVYRESPFSGTRKPMAASLRADITLGPDERLVLEGSPIAAIEIIEVN